MKGNDIFPGKYLRAADINGQTPTVTIDRVDMEKLGDDMKPVVNFVGKERGVALNKSNWNTIVELTGQDDSDHWHGCAIKLFVDPNVMYQGKRIPAIRIMAAAQPKPGKPAPVAPPPVPVEAFDSPDADDIPF